VTRLFGALLTVGLDLTGACFVVLSGTSSTAGYSWIGIFRFRFYQL